MLLNYQQTKVKAGRIRKYQAILPNKREETIIAQKTKKSSSDNAKKIQWHPAFYADLQIEFREETEKLKFEREYLLSSKPMAIDVLIIKKKNAEPIHKNIGKIFRKYNIIEYKSPSDALSVDDFYKVYGYTNFYKADTGRASLTGGYFETGCGECGIG